MVTHVLERLRVTFCLLERLREPPKGLSAQRLAALRARRGALDELPRCQWHKRTDP